METAQMIGILIPILAILIGGMILLVPIVGLTARFALKPIVEAFAHLRSTPGQDQLVSVLEQRLALMEQQLHGLESSVRRLEEDSEFQRQLTAGRNEPREVEAKAAPRVPVFDPKA
jgi:TolA-binding protein